MENGCSRALGRSKIESLEEFSEETENTLYINALEISNLKSNNELLTLQNTIFDSSIKAIEARLDILEENSGIGSILAGMWVSYLI